MIESENQQNVQKSSIIYLGIIRFLLQGINLLAIYMTGFIRSRKSQLLLVLGFLPVIVSLLSGVIPIQPYPAELFYLEFTRSIYVTLLIPLFGLLLGTAALSDEIESHTIIQIICRPVRRLEIVIWRYIATVIAGSLIGLIVSTAFFAAVSIVTPIPMNLLFGSWSLIITSCCVYSAVFIFLGLAIEKPLIWGVIVTLYEQLLGILVVFLGGGAFSLSSHITNVGSDILGYSSTIQWWAPTDSAIVLATFTFVMIALAVGIFQYKDLD